MKATNESVSIAKHINVFLKEYMPTQKTKSVHTLKAYDDALSLYIEFLETNKRVNSNNLCADNFNVNCIEDRLRKNSKASRQLSKFCIGGYTAHIFCGLQNDVLDEN
ncbi:hypothetical protein FACS1894105_10710 [Clostridia bacterium]|nr:hypothetical protein FACS1894105_10710 [Clostridia bacterium]